MSTRLTIFAVAKFKTTHDWTITVGGHLIGYRDVEVMRVAHEHHLYFGPLGSVAISSGFLLIAVLGLVAFAALAYMFYFIRIRRKARVS